ILDDEVKALTIASAGANIYYVSKLGGTTTSSIAINAIDGTGANISTFGGTFAPTNGSTLNEPTALVQISGTNLYTTGIFNTNTNFNPAGTANLSFISGGNNSFIHKMSACTTSAQTPTITGSPSSMCVGDSRVIYVNTISTPSPRLLNSNNEWVWYSGTCGTGTVVGRGESITINPTVNTTYYVRGEGGCVANGACSSAYSVLVFPYPNANVTQSGNTLTSSQATGTYQWLDCNNGNANIAGATNQSYTPTVSGSYAVRVTNSGCTVTSACINITVLSADDFSKLGVKLYPNPVTNSFTIEGEVVVENVIIYNLLGQELKTFSNTNSFNVEDLQSGTYLVQVTTERGTAQTKIIKN
ncbi:MAG: T9SS type A sorting domain-containing protein, partial [Bacteroidia bacterium]